jgi:hypothetical protein
MPSTLIMTASIVRHDGTTENDDIIIVRRVDNNVVVTYKDSEMKNKKHQLTLTNTSLGVYLKNLCFLLKEDEKPFQAVQFNFCGFPTFWIYTESIRRKAVDRLMEIAAITVESVFADSPEDHYHDMPPLVPLRQANAWDSDNDDVAPRVRHQTYSYESDAVESSHY